MTLTYRNIFPFATALIGGLVFAANQSDIAIAQSGYIPPDRPKPERTQGGGSRLKSQPVQPLFVQDYTQKPISANPSLVSLRQNACIHQSENLVRCDRFHI
jgi:hypothetical protein